METHLDGPTEIKSNQIGKEKALDYGWRYFELHAGQRMMIFNFFVALSGIVVTGLAAALQGSARFSGIGIVLGLLLTLISFVFWKLDQRVSFLIKHAEEALSYLEGTLLPDQGRLFACEPIKLSATRAAIHRWGRQWTYGECFRLVFVVMATLGGSGAALAALRFTQTISW